MLLAWNPSNTTSWSKQYHQSARGTPITWHNSTNHGVGREAASVEGLLSYSKDKYWVILLVHSWRQGVTLQVALSLSLCSLALSLSLDTQECNNRVQCVSYLVHSVHYINFPLHISTDAEALLVLADNVGGFPHNGIRFKLTVNLHQVNGMFAKLMNVKMYNCKMSVGSRLVDHFTINDQWDLYNYSALMLDICLINCNITVI